MKFSMQVHAAALNPVCVVLSYGAAVMWLSQRRNVIEATK